MTCSYGARGRGIIARSCAAECRPFLPSVYLFVLQLSVTHCGARQETAESDSKTWAQVFTCSLLGREPGGSVSGGGLVRGVDDGRRTARVRLCLPLFEVTFVVRAGDRSSSLRDGGSCLIVSRAPPSPPLWVVRSARPGSRRHRQCRPTELSQTVRGRPDPRTGRA